MVDSSLSRILIVEDELDIQLVVRFSLERLGRFQLAVAASGEEAVALAAEFQPQLILLDVMMPGLDGFATLGQLRRLSGLEQTPIVFVTARSQAHEVAEYEALGALDVIVKPFDPIGLADRLVSLWDRHCLAVR
ncbi:MAG TPA: response regulator [Thermoanaerobaculia bacterium]|nr:response regulator [Thermoanaerobaculia bacterium]